MTEQQKINKEILIKLIKATSAEEVTNLIETHLFFEKCGWRFYGDQENNAGTIKAQSPDPVGALVEKITNGIDALLVRACLNQGIDPKSPEAPQSQNEAIGKFFGDKVANFDLSEKEIRGLAQKTVHIIAEGSEDKPTISFVDFGEGQHPKDFPNTFLSIGGTNKIQIKFAHGVFNQGGAAALKFCGQGYQLILSRRAPNINNNNDDLWGFTLVRKQYKLGYKDAWYEYCVIKTENNSEVPSFPYEPLKILSEIGIFESGSFIRLYSYTLKNPNLFITDQREKALAREINKRYFSMPLPIQLHELRTQLKGWGDKNKTTRIYGLWRLLNKRFGEKDLIKTFLSLKTDLGVFGLRTLEIVILNDESKEGKSFKALPEKIFLTVNGQAQYIEQVSFLKTKCKLPDLASFMIIHINLSNAGYQANEIFRTGREGIIEIPEYENFNDRLINSIKGDETLQLLDQEYRERRLRNSQPEDRDLSKYVGKLVKDNPFISSFLKIGDEVPIEKPEGQVKKYVGNYIPTVIEIAGKPDREIPYNRYTILRIKTDAVNDYLIREKDRGEFKWLSSRLVQINHYSLRNGFIPVRIEPVEGANPGDIDNLVFELTRPNQESLKINFKIIIGEFKEPKIRPHGPVTPPTRLALKMPELKKVSKEDWERQDPPWTEEDIAKVEENQGGIIVYLNESPRVLIDFPKRNPRLQSGEMQEAIRKRFYATVYLYSIAMFFEMKDEQERRDWTIPNSLKAISKFILDLAFTQRTEQIDESQEDAEED